MPLDNGDTSTQEPTISQSAEQNACNSAYPDVCVTPVDIDCGDISISNFKVLPPDPYGFDPDKDGIGCQTSQAEVNTRGMPRCPVGYHRSPDGDCEYIG